MKVNNKVIDKPNEVILALPRADGDLIFKFRAVVDDEMFTKLCPVPNPPKVKKKGQSEAIPNFADPGYLQIMDEWSGRKTNWMFLTSIAATDGLEWETVKLDDPGTWHNWRTDMVKAGFSIGEMNALWHHFTLANSLSQSMIDEARERFLSSLRERAESLSSSMGDLSTSLSGEHANGSTSEHQELPRLGTTATPGPELR